MREISPEFTPGQSYYGSWRSYQIPRVPLEPISEEEALARNVYYLAWRDKQGRLVGFEKRSEGQMEWRDDYVLWPDGTLKRHTLEKADGSVSVTDYDEEGLRIRR